MLENYLTPTQFAKKLGITRQRVCELVRQGRIRFEKIGKQYFIRKTEKIQPPHPESEKLSRGNVTIPKTAPRTLPR